MVGLCWLQTGDECAFSLSSAVRASHLDDAIIAEMSAWAPPRLRHLEPDSSAPLIVTVLDDDNRSASILTELGFTPTGIARHHSYTRQMTDPEPEPSLPAGFTVQALTEDANLEDRVRIVTDVWPESSLTLARYYQIRSAPVYQPDLDLCITAPDGRYASFLIAWLDPERGTVQFEPIGARPEFRRMGLTRALIQSALNRSQSLGQHEL